MAETLKEIAGVESLASCVKVRTTPTTFFRIDSGDRPWKRLIVTSCIRLARLYMRRYVRSAKLVRLTETHQVQVDIDSSVEQHRTVVKHGIDEELDAIKERYDGMDDLLSRTAKAIAETIPDEIEVNLNVIYFPQLGFHITVPLDRATGNVAYDGGEENWQRAFTTENQAYYKDRRMKEMDETLGDLYAMICGQYGNLTIAAR